ncbi:Protein ninH [Labeo rohita]|uniref:Protein ninH n=1 Tax=Labeo rohita TaxID=84645 RepID=A0ABQ8LRU9_LABRO|nr:Protein ninH [Labeo rohita]
MVQWSLGSSHLSVCDFGPTADDQRDRSHRTSDPLTLLPSSRSPPNTKPLNHRLSSIDSMLHHTEENKKKWSQFGSLGYTIMGKTADLTFVQKTIIDTLHKEGKPQTFIAKQAGCSQSAVSKHGNRKFSGRKKCGKKKMHKRGVLPGLTRRRNGLLPSGPKSSFQMRASFVFYLETKVLESGGRVEKLIAQVA